MGFFRWIVIIALVILFIYFVFPDTYQSGKEKVFSVFKKSDVINDQQIIPDNDVPDNQYVPPSQTTPEEDNEAPSDNSGTQTEDLGDPCTWSFQEAPFKQGVASSCKGRDDPDFYCLDNQPRSYSGVVNLDLRTSYPILRCCVSSGLCAWR